MSERLEAERGRWDSLRSDFTLSRLAVTLSTGAVLAAVNSLLAIAIMSLIFQGGSQRFLTLGLGIGLTASAVVALFIGFGSGLPGAFAGIQDASAAILSLAAASVMVSTVTPTTSNTVVALMIVTSVATGATLLIMGRFGLGDVARYMPFPVIGGLLAGTGYLIVVGSIDILGGLSRSAASGASGLAVFWPGVVLALAFMAASQRGWAARSYLVFLVVAVGSFHLVASMNGVDVAASVDRGWLLGPFPDGSLWPGWMLGSLTGADWSVIGAEVGNIATILLVVPMTVLLYVSALEVETQRDLDVGRELRVTGLANLAAGLVGGPPGYLYLADTVVTRNLVGARRGAAVVAGAGVVLVVWAGGGLLELLPQFVIGGMLLFVGLSFLVTWLWDARRRMAPLDYLLMLTIVIVIATVGFLPGVGVGLLSAIILFVGRYSRVGVIKHLLTVREQRSNIERGVAQTQYLEAVGDRGLILELQGFIFFGTGHRIISTIKDVLGDGEDLVCVVCDFRMVTGIDSSALILFDRLAVMAEERGFELVFTDVDDRQLSQFSGLLSSFEGVRVESDLDRGVAWCEERLIEGGGEELEETSRALPVHLTARLTRYLQPVTVEEGTVLMRQGDPAPGLYLLESGRATVQLEVDDGPPVRLRTLLEGTLLGEMSLYSSQPVTASVVTETRCTLLHLSPDSFERLCETDVGLAADFHAFVARTLAARVGYANRSIRALRR